MANNHMKRCYISLVLSEKPIKPYEMPLLILVCLKLKRLIISSVSEDVKQLSLVQCWW